MIITYTYQVPLHDADGDGKVDMLRAIVAKMLPKNPHLRGLQASHTDGILQFKLRVAHLTRSKLLGEAARLAGHLVVRVGLELKEAKEVDQVREPTARGRTPRSAPPRAVTKPDGKPWEHLEWWGDQLGG